MLIFAGKYTKKHAFSGGKYPQIARKDENKNGNRNEKTLNKKSVYLRARRKRAKVALKG
jgi:hypothetical protein